MWQLSLLTMYLVIFGIADILRGDSPTQHIWTPFESIMYNCFSKTGWSLALGWIIFSCHKGYGGIVNSFLSWKAWIPLSKLTYGAYLIHINCQQIVLFGSSYPLHFTNFMMVSLFLLKILSYFQLNIFSVCVFHWNCLLCLWSFLCPFTEC